MPPASRPPAPPTDATVKALLPRSWHAFYARFPRTRAIQAHAAPILVRGLDALVCAATASGKTEAIMAPLCERTLDAGRSGIRILAISPTRALANDLQRRLRAPLNSLNIDALLKTGDQPNPRIGDRPALVVTTPESLDSLLARRPKVLRPVIAIWLDELHLLDGTARGDQLRYLLERLDRVTDGPLQRCAASATVAHPRALAARFLSPKARCLNDAGASDRGLQARLEPASTLEAAAAHIHALFQGARGRKVLAFANSRAQTEALSGLLRQDPTLRERVYTHHGSLARGERLRVEHQFKASPSAVCVATMTLEIGVDIGGVDRVVLLAPPPNVSALLQRVGRSNRRQATVHVLALYDGAFERQRLEHLLECAKAGRLFGEAMPFRPNVLAQQALSLTLQNPKGWVSAGVLRDRLPHALQSEWTRSDLKGVLRQMSELGLLREIAGERFVADQAAARLLKRGDVHSLVEDSHELEVIDRTTGRAVGQARFSAADHEKMRGGETIKLALGGITRDVAHVKQRRVYVDSGKDGGEDARFIAREAPRYSRQLATDLGRHLGLGPGEMWLVPAGRRYRLGHFLGTVWGQVLAWLLLSTGLQKRPHKSDAFFTTVDQLPPAEAGLGLGDEATLRATLAGILADQRKALARRLGVGPFFSAVPDALLDAFVAEAIDLDALVARLLQTQLVAGPTDSDNSNDPPADEP